MQNLKSIFVCFLFLSTISEISLACNIKCTETGCLTTGNNCPKESADLISETSMVPIDCGPNKECGKQIVTALYSKYGCKSTAQGSGHLHMVMAQCLVKENTKQDLCPSGTTAKIVDEDKLIKICLKSANPVKETKATGTK